LRCSSSWAGLSVGLIAADAFATRTHHERIVDAMPVNAAADASRKETAAAQASRRAAIPYDRLVEAVERPASSSRSSNGDT
jgi:hypothetical protein